MAPFATSKLLLVALAGIAAAMGASASPLPDEPGYASNAHGLSARDDTLPPDQILAECPGGSVGSSDACSFEANGGEETVYYYILSQAISNCSPGATAPATDTKRVTNTITNGWSMSTSVGAGAEYESIGAKITVEGSYSESTATANYEGLSVSANPGKQAALVVQQAYTRHNGRLRANYGSRRQGHYVWYIPFHNDVIQEGNYIREAVSFECGQDPAAEVSNWNNDPTNQRFKN